MQYNDNGAILEGEKIESSTIWLRSVVDKDCVNRYFYSFDGIDYKAFGEAYKLRWGGFRGDNIGIFSYNDLGESGWIDVDWFRYGF